MKKFIFTLLLMLPLSLMAQVQIFMDIPVVSVEQYTAELIEKGFVFVEVESKDSTQTSSAAVNMKTLKGKYLDEEVTVFSILEEERLSVCVSFSPKEGYAIEGRVAEIAEKYEKASGVKFMRQGDTYNFTDAENMCGVFVASEEDKVLLMYICFKPKQ